MAEGDAHVVNEIKELQRLFEKAIKGLGYVVFIGVLTKKKDEKKNFIIDYDYRRFHMNADDVKQSLSIFRDHVAKDLIKDL